MAAWPVIAPAMAEEAPALVISVVTGLAPDDLLKVRTTASPVAKVEVRLSSGDMVTNLGCNDINGYKWCKIESTGKEKLSGWAPARYLIPLNPAPYVEGEPRPADAPVVASTGSNEAEPASDKPQAAGVDVPAKPPVAPPPDLTARLGGAGPAAESTPRSAAEIGRAAMQDAYVLALAAPDVPLDPALTPASGPEIPCARYVGQPMERCKVSVVHTADKANITVTWPDGGTRIISFRAGQPAGSDAPGDFRFTREGRLNMIRVGEAERFEITDQLALGD
ncbi:SH3 domain-containing protein [Mesorhizobium sp. M7A.F.Ca.US.008.03.1.1]|nr:SH3 domain-containing protein [Mesorhizobium sp. M7A.F.Ca.US.008.03.1.1]